MTPDVGALADLLDALGSLPRPAAVGLSGYGGSGKTTLALEAAARVPGLAVVAADDFLDPAGCAVVTDDWAGLDRARLRRQVLDPFRTGQPLRWQRHDWVSGTLAEWHELRPGDLLLVEGVGVLHPSLRWDLSVWLEVDAAAARDRGIARDRALGHDSDALWRQVWAPTDAAYAARFGPAGTADLVLR